MPVNILQVAHVVPRTEAEGPGSRFAVWLQGCPLRCPGCCNPEMLPFEGGQSIPVETLFQQIADNPEQPVEGVTFLGGEPFSQAEAAAALARLVRHNGLSVMVFTGWTLRELLANPDPHIREFLEQIDLLIDGRYERDAPESGRRWIGSSNQQIHFLSDRYRKDDVCWKLPNTLEIRFVDGALSVNGFPARHAVKFWKHPDQHDALGG